MSKLQQENKMTTQVAGALYDTEKRNVLDWLRDKMTARTAGLLYLINGTAGLFSYKIVPGRLIAACFGYVANSLMLLLLPSYAPIVSLVTVFSYILGGVGEGSMQLWLLIMGAKVPRVAASSLDRAVIARATSAATATSSVAEESRISE